MERINAYENLRGLVYSPFYIGLAEGLFRDAGVDLNATLSPSGEETAAGAAAGRVDVAWGGPIRVMAAHDADPEANLVCFGLAVERDPFLVIGRHDEPSFHAGQLPGKRLAVATLAPTPWILLQEDIRRAGADPAAVSRADPVEPEDALDQLAAGAFDYVLAFEPWGASAESSGRGVVVSAGARRGPLAFTSFYGPRSFVAERPEAARALVDGLGRSLARIRTMAPGAAAAAVKPWFPDLAPETIAASIARYQSLHLWPETPEMTADGFVRLKSSLLSAGYIASDPSFEKLTVAV